MISSFHQFICNKSQQTTTTTYLVEASTQKHLRATARNSDSIKLFNPQADHHLNLHDLHDRSLFNQEHRCKPEPPASLVETSIEIFQDCYLKKSLHINSYINQLDPVLDEPPSSFLEAAEITLSIK
ncbi:hypothetical protein BT93_I0031 [Corymbia citriodora subsp. variegata]|nr:hypothetical protein BT93_I0031 [Corymbia citriodora subsp. variegata]